MTIGCSGAEVFRVVAAGEADRFLKVTRRGEWHSAGDEFRRLEWLRGRLSVPEVLLFEKDAQREFLLTSALAGVMAQDSALARDPKALLAALAEGMRAIHALPAEGCPFDGRLDVMLALAEDRVRRGAVNVADFEPENLGRTAEDILAELRARRPAEDDLVFCHGDFCFPNIMIDGLRTTGFLDWGLGGVSDRWRDLGIAASSVKDNLGAEWLPVFAEACGVAWDAEKARYYQLLYELL